MQKMLPSHSRWYGRVFLALFLTMSLLLVEPFLLGGKFAWSAGQGEVVVLTVGGSWGDLTKEHVGERFTKRYGAQVTYDIRPNTEQIIALQASKANPIADLVEVSLTRLARGTMWGLFAEQDEVKVPNRKFVPKQFKTHVWTARGFTSIILVYNKTKVDEKDCTSWDVLTNPKYKGRVGLMKYGWNGEQFLHAVNKIRGGTYDDVTPGLRFCRKIIENGGTVLNSNDHVMRLFESGELWIASYYPGRAEQLIKKGVPLVYRYVPGSLAYTWGFSVVNNSKNTDLAYKWVNLSLEPEVQVEYAKKLGYAPTNTNTVVPTGASLASRVSKEEMAMIVDLDGVEIAKTTDKNLERFNIEVLR